MSRFYRIIASELLRQNSNFYFGKALFGVCFLLYKQLAKVSTNLQATNFCCPASIPGFFNLSFLGISRLRRAKFRNAYEVERAISDLTAKADELLFEERYEDARSMLHDALRIADESGVYSNISSVYDLLSTVAFKESGVREAEEVLVKCIERLINLGYPENHNSIIRFKLKLARLYQISGVLDMAEYGFKDCIRLQDEKFQRQNPLDAPEKIVYISSLFWYGRLLIDASDFKKAKTYMNKALEESSSDIAAASQKIVILYYCAEIATNLKEYDEALDFLYKAVDLCKKEDASNPDISIFLSKIGAVYLLKGQCQNAEFWCYIADELAKKINNKRGSKEAYDCLEAIAKYKTLCKGETSV